MGCRRRHAQPQVALGWPLPCGFLATVPSSQQRQFAPTSLSPDSWQWGRATAATSRVPVSSPFQAWPLQSSCVAEGTSLGSGPRPAVRVAAHPTLTRHLQEGAVGVCLGRPQHLDRAATSSAPQAGVVRQFLPETCSQWALGPSH